MVKRPQCVSEGADDLDFDGVAALQNVEYLYALRMLKIFSIVWIIIIIFAAFVSVIRPWGRIGKTKDEAEPSPVGTT